MEQKSPKHQSSAKGQESLSYQRRVWKNFQEKTKPLLSPKLGLERRGTTGGAEASKKESGLWMFKRKKKHLDRVISSSQPNLCCSSPAPFEGEKTYEIDAVPGSSAGGEPLLHPLGAACGATGSKPELTAQGSPKLPVSQLIMHQQKSSSLGSTCFEKLVMDSAAEEEQLRKNASDSVSQAHAATQVLFTGMSGCQMPWKCGGDKFGRCVVLAARVMFHQFIHCRVSSVLQRIGLRGSGDWKRPNAIAHLTL